MRSSMPVSSHSSTMGLGRDRVARSTNRALVVPWVLRWDTVEEPRPRLLGTPESAPKRSSVAEADDGSFVAFDGYLFDRRELSPAAAESDAWLTAASYRRWRSDTVDRLGGAFLLAVWDQGRRCLTVGRDATGLRPC